MKTDTLTGPNLSYHVAVLDGESNVIIEGSKCFCVDDLFGNKEYDYTWPITFQPIAEREKISVKWVDNKMWQATTTNKNTNMENSRYQRTVIAWGDTEAEARMRCYVKSYLGDDTKGE